MSARAAYDLLPNQEEEDFNTWGLFPGRRDGKAAEPAISTDGKYVENLQHQKILGFSSSLNPRATYLDIKHSPSEMDGSDPWKLYVRGAAGLASRTDSTGDQAPTWFGVGSRGRTSGTLSFHNGQAVEPTISMDGRYVEKLQHQEVLASPLSLISPRATYLDIKHSPSETDGSNPWKFYVYGAAEDPFLPMKKAEPSHSHSKPVIATSVEYQPNNIGFGKRTLNKEPAKSPYTIFSSLKPVKVEPEFSLEQKGRSNAIVGTSSSRANHMGRIGSQRTKDLAQRICEICAETKQNNEMIRINKTCFHSFCSTCISKYIKTRITDNQVTVPCPEFDCKHAVEFQSCVGILPRDVLEAWDRALCKSLVLDVHKFYCPFRDCSAMLVDDSEKVVVECECPHCYRLFCAQCHVPWHTGVSCKEFQALNEGERGDEDLRVRKLATEMKWGRCPQCKFYVERTGGCPHIICRCGYEFCYGCGSKWSQGHGGCSRS